MTEQEIMADFDEEKYVSAYCRKHNCSFCTGTTSSGEPNGYGCEGLENRINTMYTSILNRRKKKLEL
ncbi:hypothetical protein [Clostridium botulinum]|uniref:hypothetical protein n=1 Tax=Clostridium botulinum TaxID=1491 RepID=UPI002492D767|nr:hypothetical protein [Clostridium botulinum]BDB03753.1 hypothetical protein CBOS2020_38270 [Clostridium botulinum]